MTVADRAAEAFQRCFDADPTTTASAPSRVNLGGGHTDYNAGYVLPMGVDRRNAVAARPRSDNKLRVHSATVGETATADGDPRGDWTDYLAGVRWALRDAGHAVGGADLAVASDVPVGAGLSSSAALEMATCRALDRLGDLGLDGPTAARCCTRAENEFVGVPCGVLDGYAAACAPAAGALELDCRTLETRPAPLGDCGVVVLDTGVRHDLADSAYADRVATCERGVELLAARLDHSVDALRDVSIEAFERVAGDLPERVHARCRHVVTENNRVQAARRALDCGNPARAGELMDASHRSLRDDYAVSCRELDAAAAAGRATDGVLGSRLTGAGFGGCTVHLVAGDPAQVADTLAAAYHERVGAEPEVYPCAPSPGAYAPSVSST
ncbi:galactokinase [Halobacteriales archaeon QS_9_67_17]|nr:MAG: galactokinase [Halobacteriales archaeon QS_9_67_17]